MLLKLEPEEAYFFALCVKDIHFYVYRFTVDTYPILKRNLKKSLILEWLQFISIV